MRATLFSVSLLVTQAFAAVFITSPTQGTQGVGGQNLTLQWNESPDPPTLADIGPCEVGVYVGSTQQQTEVQPIIASVDVSKVNTLTFTVQPNIGPNAPVYFIRLTSLSLPAPDQPQFKYQSFSSKFTLSGMSGTFSPAIQAQIAGTSSATGAPTSAAPSTTASKPISTSSSAKVSSTASTANNTASGAAAAKTNAALVARSNMSILGVVAILVGMML